MTMNKPTNSTFVKHISNTKSRFYRLRNKLVKAILPERFYSDSCLIATAIPHWQNKPSFEEIRNQAAKIVNQSYPDEWKLRVALWAARQASGGDFVECGVHKGYISTALLLAGYPITNKFYLCDCWDIGCYDSSWDQAQLTFSRWGDKIKLIRGYMPEMTKKIDSQKISYLYLDMNDGQVELDTLYNLWPQLQTGAIIILDDYSYPGFSESMSPWINSYYNILPLPTGQGMIIKS